MKQKIPHSPFSTRLSGSARETELRLRNIFQWKKKRPPVVLFVLTALALMFCFGLFSCQPSENISEAKPSANVPAKDTRQETETANSSSDEILTLTTADGRVLTVKLYLAATERDQDWFSVTKTEVREGEELLQTIDPALLQDHENYLFEGLYVLRGHNLGEPDVRDMNFDGSEDLGLLATDLFSQNVPYRYFLWDEELGQLVDSFVMRNLPTLDVERQWIVEEWTDDVTSYYKWENGRPVLIRQTQFEGEETEVAIYRDELTGLTLNDVHEGDDSVSIEARLAVGSKAKDEVKLFAVLDGNRVLTHTWEDHVIPKLLSGRITSTQRDSVVVELQSTTSNYGAAYVYVLEIQDGELNLFCYNEPMNEDNVVYGTKVMPLADSELSCVRIPTLAGKWHSLEWNTLTWENGQWKDVPDGYFTDTYTLTVDDGVELTLALRGRSESVDKYRLITYYDRVQILHGETVLQTITEDSFEPDDHCPYEYFNADASFHNVHVQDINFDGNTDFGIPCDNTHRDTHCWFVYNPGTRTYEYAFSLAGTPEILEENKQIVETVWQDGYIDTILYNTYEYDSAGRLVLVHSEVE